MIQLTPHQETMMAALTYRVGSPATPKSVARALPQYSKQQAAMIVGSLWAKGQVVVCTPAALNEVVNKQREAVAKESQLNEENIRKYLSENKEFAKTVIAEFAPPPPVTALRVSEGQERELRVAKLRRKYTSDLQTERKQTKEPVILSEFNKNFSEKYGHLWDCEASHLIEAEVPNFLQGNLIKAVQRENLDKFLDIYMIEMSKALEKSQDYILDFYCSETRALLTESIRYSSRDLPILCEKTGAKLYSFDKVKLLKVVQKIAKLYVEHFPVGGKSLRNHLEILGLSEGFTSEELKKSFRALAMKHHPDRGGDVEIFQRLETAYTTLKKTFK